MKKKKKKKYSFKELLQALYFAVDNKDYELAEEIMLQVILQERDS